MKDNFSIVSENLTSTEGRKLMPDPDRMDFPAEGYNNFSFEDLFGKKDERDSLVYSDLGDVSPLDQFNDTSSSGESKISESTIEAALGTATGVLQLFGNKRQLSEVEGVCGKQPRPILFGKGKKARWAKCASDYMASKARPTIIRKGLGTGAWIGIGIGSAALLGMIIYIATQKKAVDVPAPVPT